MTSFTLNLISVKVSFHDIFKKTLNITPVNITNFTVLYLRLPIAVHIFLGMIEVGKRVDKGALDSLA